MTFLHSARRLLNAAGLDVHRFADARHNESRRLQLTLDAVGARTVLDVGAHHGEFAAGLRRSGFSGRMISFEPDSRSFPVLQARCATDRLWSAHQFACSNLDGETQFQLAANEVSSSLRTATRLHEVSAPESTTIGTQSVVTRRLDRWMDAEGLTLLDQVFVKVDVQGAELEVLDGLGTKAQQVAGFLLEVSFRPLYAGAPTHLTVLQRLDDLGFVPCSVAPVFLDKTTGLCLQADITFVRRDPVESPFNGQ